MGTVLRYVFSGGYNPDARHEDILIDLAGYAIDFLIWGLAGGCWVDFPFLGLASSPTAGDTKSLGTAGVRPGHWGGAGHALDEHK